MDDYVQTKGYYNGILQVTKQNTLHRSNYSKIKQEMHDKGQWLKKKRKI